MGRGVLSWRRGRFGCPHLATKEEIWQERGKCGNAASSDGVCVILNQIPPSRKTLSNLHTLTVASGRYCCCAMIAVVGFSTDEAVAEMFHRLDCSCWTFFCSFSFWVSANFTTIGEEHPSIVCEWWVALMAVMAHWRVEKVTKAQPGKQEGKGRVRNKIAYYVRTPRLSFLF